MLLLVNGIATRGQFVGDMVTIFVGCEQSVYPCYMKDTSWSITTYLNNTNNILVRRVSDKALLPNTDEQFYHVCIWDRTLAVLDDVTIDFYLKDITIEVRSDDYTKWSIAQYWKDMDYQNEYGNFKEYDIFCTLKVFEQFEDWSKCIDIASMLMKVATEDERAIIAEKVVSYQMKIRSKE